MNAFMPFYDVSSAGSMAATLCSRAPQETQAFEPAPFVATPRAPCPALPAAPCKKAAGWRRLADAAFDLVSGPTLTPSPAARRD
jgi:hypothetical protein